jgi:hypothetical protein
MLDFIELSELLSRIQAKVCASECHGFLCGQVCASGVPEEEIWQEFLNVQSEDDDLVYESYALIHTLIREISEHMHSPELEFHLFLPNGESPLQDRVAALTDWCHGFLNGFGLGTGLRGEAFSEDCREVLTDYTKICQMVLDEETDEEDEWALEDLIEYVRMGAVLIFEETYPDLYGNNLRTLH